MSRFLLPTAVGAGLLLALAAPMAASAHVTVDPDSAEPGSYALITVKVPNESDTASTNRLELTLPADEPFTSVRTVPVPGWSAELVTEGDLVTSIVWTASPGAEIGDGQLQLFPISVGPVPDVGSVLLPASQGYTDGTVVQWNEQGEDAEHPAPVLFINDAPAGHHAEQPADDGPVAAASDADVLARILAIGGLAVGAVGVVLAITARRSANR